jgi:hypothetical protein
MNIFKALWELPIRRATQVLRNKVEALNNKIGFSPANFDQLPGKANTWCFSCLYGPIPLTDGTAQTNDLSLFYLPQGQNILTGRDASFFWTETNVFAFGQRNAIGLTNKSIFDPERIGGGGTVIQNFQGPQAVNNNNSDANDDTGEFAKISLEIDLYDKKRGRSITNGPMPTQVLQGGAFDFRAWAEAPRFDPDTEIEPRLYVRDASQSPSLTALNTVFFVNIVFKGVSVLQEVTGRESLLAGRDGVGGEW